MATQKQLLVTLGYSQDNGLTWKTKDVKVSDHRFYLDTETVHEHKLVWNRRNIEYTETRIFVDLHIDFRNYVPSVDTDESAFIFVQKWIGAKTKRICTNGVTVWGFTDFSLSNNTAYLILRGKEERDVPNSDIRSIILNLKCRDEYVIS